MAANGFRKSHLTPRTSSSPKKSGMTVATHAKISVCTSVRPENRHKVNINPDNILLNSNVLSTILFTISPSSKLNFRRLSLDFSQSYNTVGPPLDDRVFDNLPLFCLPSAHMRNRKIEMKYYQN